MSDTSGPRRAAVLGSPIEHSLSPLLHNAAYAALGLDGWEYTAHECREDELRALVGRLDDTWVGLSLTMPLKRVALDIADEVSDRAAAIGAANTLVLGGGVRRADNTDAPGMADALREVGLTVVKRPLVIGAGGTAQAALAALRDFTRDPVTVIVREPARASELVATAERLGVTLELARFPEIEALLTTADLIVSTVPKGTVDRFAGVPLAAGTVV